MGRVTGEYLINIVTISWDSDVGNRQHHIGGEFDVCEEDGQLIHVALTQRHAP